MSKQIKNTELDSGLRSNTEWLFGVNPNIIEQQERQGQEQLINSCQLPIKKFVLFGGNYFDAKEQYESLGIKVLQQSSDDDLFYDVELPIGWSKKATDHSMWSDLLDDKGNVVANIFYKAAWFDSSAHIVFKEE